MTTEDAFFSHTGAADYMAGEDYSYSHEPRETLNVEPQADLETDFLTPTRSAPGAIKTFDLGAEGTLFGFADITPTR